VHPPTPTIRPYRPSSKCLRKHVSLTSYVLFSLFLLFIRNVKQAIEILTDKDGIGMPKSKITVSTSGVAPGLAKLAELGGISLAISLHATNDNLRDEIVPINKYVRRALIYELISHK